MFQQMLLDVLNSLLVITVFCKTIFLWNAAQVRETHDFRTDRILEATIPTTLFSIWSGLQIAVGPWLLVKLYFNS